MPSAYDARDDRYRRAAAEARRAPSPSLTRPSPAREAAERVRLTDEDPTLGEPSKPTMPPATPINRAAPIERRPPATPSVLPIRERPTPIAADPRAVDAADDRPTTTPRAPSGAPAQPTDSFSAGNNLRSSQINPDMNGASMDQARAAIERMMSLRPTLEGLMNQQVAAPSSYAPSVEAAAARARMMEAMNSLYTAPDRMGLAGEALSIYDQRSQPALDQALKSVVGRAAAAGRTRAGMTTNELTNVGTQWKDRRDIFGREIINDALQRAMEDRLNRLSATQSAGGFLSSDDLQTAGMNQSLREEQRAELARRFGMGESIAGFDTNAAQQYGAIANNQYDWGVGQREEQRGEREYQNRLALDAQAARERQAEMEDRFQTNDTDRQLAWAQSLIEAGVDPALIQALLSQGGA